MRCETPKSDSTSRLVIVVLDRNKFQSFPLSWVETSDRFGVIRLAPARSGFGLIADALET
jgi:hypothetical protein